MVKEIERKLESVHKER
jgi:DNA polymerase sigma